MMDDKLDYLLLNAPGRSFVLLEDIDAAFNKRVQTSSDGCVALITYLRLELTCATQLPIRGNILRPTQCLRWRGFCGF